MFILKKTHDEEIKVKNSVIESTFDKNVVLEETVEKQKEAITLQEEKIRLLEEQLKNIEDELIFERENSVKGEISETEAEVRVVLTQDGHATPYIRYGDEMLKFMRENNMVQDGAATFEIQLKIGHMAKEALVQIMSRYETDGE